MLDLQPSTIVFQIINFLILLVILRRFLYEPVQRTMTQRQAAITAQLNDAAAREREAVAERERLREQREAARVESEQVLAQLRAQAAAEQERLLASAREQANQLEQAAERDIRESRQRALDETAAHLRATSLSVAGSLIRQAAGPVVHQALVDRFVATGLPFSEAADTEFVAEVAYPPDAELEQRLHQLTGGHVTFRLNPDLCAGIRLLTDDRVIVELSIRRTLEELESHANGVAA